MFRHFGPQFLSVHVSRKSAPLFEGMHRPSGVHVSASSCGTLLSRQHILVPLDLQGACLPEASADPFGKKHVADT